MDVLSKIETQALQLLDELYVATSTTSDWDWRRE